MAEHCGKRFIACIGTEAIKFVVDDGWLCTLSRNHPGPHDWPEGRATYGPAISEAELDTILEQRKQGQDA